MLILLYLLYIDPKLMSMVSNRGISPCCLVSPAEASSPQGTEWAFTLYVAIKNDYLFHECVILVVIANTSVPWLAHTSLHSLINYLLG